MKKLNQKGFTQYLLQQKPSINLYISETSSIKLENDRIIFKVKGNELILDERGLSINKPVSVKK